MNAIHNRYDFVYLFDVTNGTPTATQTQVTCHVSTLKRIKVLYLTCV